MFSKRFENSPTINSLNPNGLIFESSKAFRFFKFPSVWLVSESEAYSESFAFLFCGGLGAVGRSPQPPGPQEQKDQNP